VQGNTDLIALHHVVEASKGGSSSLITLLPIAALIAGFYFLLIRPQKNRQRKQAALQNQVSPGQRVMTTAGMYATVVEIDDDGVVLEIAPGVEARFVRQAIGQVLPDDIDDEYLEDEDVEDEDLEDEDVEGERAEDEVGDELEHEHEEGVNADAEVRPESLAAEKKPSA
jgi:preprotein translocase subunit YajC